MNSKIITLQELSKIIDIYPDTLRTWLQGYRFTKFYCYPNCITFDKEFIKTMSEFLKLKHRHGTAKYLTNYYKKISCK